MSTDPNDPAVNDHGLELWETAGLDEPVFLALDGGGLQDARALLSLAGFELGEDFGIRAVSERTARNRNYAGWSIWLQFEDVSEEGVVCPSVGDRHRNPGV